MKKSLFVLAVMAIFAVKADYLYWMITDNPGTHENFVGTSIDFNQWDEAKLFVGGSSFDGSDAVATMSKEAADALRGNGLYAYASIDTGYEGTTFLIELWQDSSYLGCAKASAADLAQYIFTPDTMAPVVGGWMPDAISYSVPEPTSGLLFLLGGMLLGLKRRRQEV